MNETKCRAVVKARSEGRCEMCGQPGVQMHHRQNRSQGGRWEPSNILHLCVECHGFVTTEPTISQRMGWTVRRISDPALILVWRFDLTAGERRLVKLDDDGGLEYQEAA
jgi:hypothetical protein